MEALGVHGSIDAANKPHGWKILLVAVVGGVLVWTGKTLSDTSSAISSLRQERLTSEKTTELAAWRERALHDHDVRGGELHIGQVATVDWYKNETCTCGPLPGFCTGLAYQDAKEKGYKMRLEPGGISAGESVFFACRILPTTP